MCSPKQLSALQHVVATPGPRRRPLLRQRRRRGAPPPPENAAPPHEGWGLRCLFVMLSGQCAPAPPAARLHGHPLGGEWDGTGWWQRQRPAPLAAALERQQAELAAQRTAFRVRHQPPPPNDRPGVGGRAQRPCVSRKRMSSLWALVRDFVCLSWGSQTTIQIVFRKKYRNVMVLDRLDASCFCGCHIFYSNSFFFSDEDFFRAREHYVHSEGFRSLRRSQWLRCPGNQHLNARP